MDHPPRFGIENDSVPTGTSFWACTGGLPAASRRTAARPQNAMAREGRTLSRKGTWGSPMEHVHCSTGVKLNIMTCPCFISGNCLSRTERSFSTSTPRQFRKRPMKLAYWDSWMCQKTLTAEIQSGASNVSMSDPSRPPDNLCEPHPARKTERFCPVEKLNMAKRAARRPGRTEFRNHRWRTPPPIRTRPTG